MQGPRDRSVKSAPPRSFLEMRVKITIISCSLLTVIFTACGGAAATPTGPSAAGEPGARSAFFALTSPVGVDGGTMPAGYTCDGAGSSLPLSWSNAPAGTREFALLMTTLPGDGTTKWNWVLYNIPGTLSSLQENSRATGTAGLGSDGPIVGYQPPCSQGPGLKLYTITLYALSASPRLSVPASQVTGSVLASAISSITLGSASLTLGYTRPR